MILFGVVVLNDAITPLAALGVVVAMGGGLWYAQERKRLSEAPRPRPDVQDEKGALLSMEEGKVCERRPHTISHAPPHQPARLTTSLRPFDHGAVLCRRRPQDWKGAKK